jgi:tetratricopeptide (TPR) repeat protein
MNTITFIATSNIVPNAGYSRAVMDQDLIEFIRNSIRQNNGIKAEYALKVRQVHNDVFEIIDGHIRFEAAKQENLEELPCIVVEMDDNEAYMALIQENKCQEMTGLDIGLHALGFESRVGGRGKKSDLTLYAEKIGKLPQNVRQYRNGAKVYKHIEPELVYDEKMKLRSKATVLCKFKTLTPRSWLGLSKIVVNCKYKNGDLEKGTRLVKKIMEIENSEEWIDAFMSYDKIIEFSMEKRTSHHILNYIFKNLNNLKKYYEENGRNNEIIELYKWLSSNAFEIDRYGKERLRFRKIVQHCNIIMHEADKFSGRWIEGDCLKHIHTIADNSISLLLTDPPYGCTYRSISNTTNRTIANDTPEDATRLLKNSLDLLWPKMKENSCAIIFCHDTMLHKFGIIIENAGFTIKNVLTWEKM